MTPELKRACELIFQEHKTLTQPLKWSSETFRGRISLGISELARETLIKKHILLQAEKSRKLITQLNPIVLTASSVEEAQEWISKPKPVAVPALVEEKNVTVVPKARPIHKVLPRYAHRVVEVPREEAAAVAELKWYLRPAFLYVLWPLCAIVAGILLTFLIDQVFTLFFLH